MLEPLTPHGAALDGLVVRPLDTDIPFYFGAITPQSRPLAAPVQALADALLAAASVLPGFVQRDLGDHARLLNDGAPTRSAARKPAR